MNLNNTSSKLIPKVAVIIPTYNRCNHALRAIHSLECDNYWNKDIYLVIDGSTDNTKEKVTEKHPQIKICLGDGNLWWSGAINLGLTFALKSDCHLVLWLNDDNCVEIDTISRMVQAHQLVGEQSIIAARTMSVQTRSDEWSGEPPRWHPDYASWTKLDCRQNLIQLEHPPGGRGVLFPINCFTQLGLIDKQKFPHYWADHDFHYRAMKAGYKYHLACTAIVWNAQNEPIVPEQMRYSAIGLFKFLFSRRSPMNFITLRRLLKRHLEPQEYKKIGPTFMKNTLIWLLFEWINTHPKFFSILRGLTRYRHLQK